MSFFDWPTTPVARRVSDWAAVVVVAAAIGYVIAAILG